jgi:hypothetical protein
MRISAREKELSRRFVVVCLRKCYELFEKTDSDKYDELLYAGAWKTSHIILDRCNCFLVMQKDNKGT